MLSSCHVAQHSLTVAILRQSFFCTLTTDSFSCLYVRVSHETSWNIFTPFSLPASVRCVHAATLIDHQNAVAVSHVASVSSLTAVLAILCAFSATNRCSLGVHEQVLKEAFLCLTSITGTAPDTSARAECIKAALVSLRECIQVFKGSEDCKHRRFGDIS